MISKVGIFDSAKSFHFKPPQLGFMLIALIWKFDFSPFMVLIIAILNDGDHSHLLKSMYFYVCNS